MYYNYINKTVDYMKKVFKKFIVCTLLFSLILSISACNTKENKVKKIGIIEKTLLDTIYNESFSDWEKVTFNAISEMPEALIEGKIDAYLADDPVARIDCKKHPELTITRRVIGTDYGLALPLDHTELQAQLNEYLQKLKDTGILESKESIWLGDYEDLYEIDMDGLTGENGELKVAVSTDSNDKFVFIKDGMYMGYEVDILVSFAKEYGYSISFVDMSLASMLDDVAAGVYDIGASCIIITDERKSRMLFTDYDYQGSVVLVEKKSDSSNTSILSINDLEGHNIGLEKGTSGSEIYNKYFLSSNPVYFDSSSALAEALEKDEISAYISDEPIVRAQNYIYPNHRQLTRLKSDTYAFAFPKQSNFSLPLRAMFNEFLKDAKNEGTLNELDELWFNNTIEKDPVDYQRLTGENGTINFGINTGNAPFSYKDDSGFYGYDLDLAVRFCRKYGFALNIADYSTFTDMIDNVSSGNCDMAASCITVTEERKEIVDFSDSVYEGGLVLVAKAPKLEKVDGEIRSTDDLSGLKVGVQAGTMLDEIATKYLPDSPKDYYNSVTDLAIALETGKISAYCADEPMARLMCEEYDTHRILSIMTTESYGFVFPKKNDNSAKLQEQMNAFLTKIEEDGTLAEIDSLWFGNDEDSQVIDYSDLTGENGKLTMAVCTAAGAPFVYVKDNNYVGYDVDITHRFCKEYGYDLTIVDYNADGIFSCIGSGKCDLAASCIALTEERKETMRFSFPNYEGGCVVVIKDINANKENVSFFESIKNSFYRTFIREDRWKLFANGFGLSLLIVFASVIFGTIFGLFLYYIYWHGHKIYCRVLDIFMFIIEKMPVVVILMIIYYIVFSKIDIGGVAVSIIGFSMLFGLTVVGLLKTAVGAVSNTQKEAAIALGYSESQALIYFILPQATVHFLPGYKSALVSLIKDTAIVGYIAVQDLTKVSDIVRSRTYEAFFPLIAAAIIYFVIAIIMILIVKQIEFNVNLDKRKVSLMKGVKTR